MTKIEVFPDNTGGKQINRDKLEEFLKQVKSAIVTEHITGNDSVSVGFTKTLAVLCQKLFNELMVKTEEKTDYDYGDESYHFPKRYLDMTLDEIKADVERMKKLEEEEKQRAKANTEYKQYLRLKEKFEKSHKEG